MRSALGRDLPHLAGVRHRFVDAGGPRLHLAELGPEQAPPVLLVHGWPQHWWCWRKVAPLLAEDHRVLMPDLRGHGWSEAPTYGYDKDQLATDLEALLDGLGLEAVDYIGHDWGAYIGFLLAIRQPTRINSLLALSAPHPWPSLRDRVNPWRLLAFGYQVPLSLPLLGPGLMRAGLTREVLRRGAPKGTFNDRDLEVFNARMGSPYGARVTTALYRTFVLRELPRLAAGRLGDSRIDLPIVLMVGDDDPIVRGADLGGFEDHARQMAVERIPDAGHFLPEERPALVARRAIEQFGGGPMAAVA